MNNNTAIYSFVLLKLYPSKLYFNSKIHVIYSLRISHNIFYHFLFSSPTLPRSSSDLFTYPTSWFPSLSQTKTKTMKSSLSQNCPGYEPSRKCGCHSQCHWRTDFPCPSSCQLVIAPWLGTGLHAHTSSYVPRFCLLWASAGLLRAVSLRGFIYAHTQLCPKKATSL